MFSALVRANKIYVAYRQQGSREPDEVLEMHTAMTIRPAIHHRGTKSEHYSSSRLQYYQGLPNLSFRQRPYRDFVV